MVTNDHDYEGHHWISSPCVLAPLEEPPILPPDLAPGVIVVDELAQLAGHSLLHVYYLRPHARARFMCPI